MPGLIEFGLFFVGTAIVSWGAFLFGKNAGRKEYCDYLMEILGDEGKELLAEGFDDKVDIVCNACGLVAEVTCASCSVGKASELVEDKRQPEDMRHCVRCNADLAPWRKFGPGFVERPEGDVCMSHLTWTDDRWVG